MAMRWRWPPEKLVRVAGEQRLGLPGFGEPRRRERLHERARRCAASS